MAGKRASTAGDAAAAGAAAAKACAAAGAAVAEAPAAAAAKAPAPAAAKASAVRPAGASDDVIPAKKPRLEIVDDSLFSPHEAPPPPLPIFPEGTRAMALDVIVLLIPWVQSNLKDFIKRHSDRFNMQDLEVYQHQPLKIFDAENNAQSIELLSSYKAPWNVQVARGSFDGTQMYEAGGNLCWVGAIPRTDDDKVISGDPVTWGQVVDVARTSFAKTLLAVSDTNKVERIVFPIMLCVHATMDAARSAEFFNGSLVLVCGHAYVYAWYFSMFEALRAGNVDKVAALWQCGLTCTLQCRVNMSVPQLATLSCQQSELHKTTEKVVSDSFPAFALKTLRIVSQCTESNRTKKLQEQGIRYKGALVNKGMMSGILLFEDKIDQRSLAVLRDIEITAGRDALTGGYSKLQRLVNLCAKEADHAGEPCNDLVLYVLQYMRFALKFEQIDARTITIEWMDKSKDGTPGMVTTVLARRAVILYVQALVEDLRRAGVAPSILSEMDQVLPFFMDPESYEAKFHSDPLGATQGESEEVDAEEGEKEEGQQDDALEDVKKQFQNKITHMALDFAFDVLAGSSDAGIKQAITGKASVRDVSWPQADGMVALRDLYRNLNLHQSVVHVGKAMGAPVASTRTLQRYGSDADPEEADRQAQMLKERQDIWRQAQAQRKKFVTVGHCKCATKSQAQSFYEKTSAFQFAGRPGEAHRVFLFSAEMFTESRTSPWTNPGEFDKAAGPLLDFLLAQTGPADILVLMDGRSKSWRRELDKLAERARHLTEVWLVYQNTPRLGRKVSFGSDNREVALLSMPVSRTMLPCKDRKEYVGAGETSTHDTTYTGVEPMAWGSMPKVTKEDKAKILGFEPQYPRAKLFDCSVGSPLWWQERKTPTFWKVFLANLDAKMVFDATPGAGSAGRAAMELGITYTCMAKNAEHNSWLQNVFDRAAMQVMMQNGSPLFEQDLSTCIGEHFKDVLDQLHQQDACEDVPPEDDAE